MVNKKVGAALLIFCLVFASGTGYAKKDPFSYKQRRKDFKVQLKEEKGRYRVYEVSFPTGLKTDFPENDTSFGLYFEPRDKNEFPAVVVLPHMAGGIRKIEGSFCRSLARTGIAALLIELGYQKAEGPEREVVKRLLDRLDADGFIELFKQGVVDARKGADWLLMRPNVKKDKLGIMGISFGALWAVVVAAVDERFTCGAYLLAGGDLLEIIKRSPTLKPLRKKREEEGITYEELKERLSVVEPLNYAQKAQAKNPLMISAMFDRDIPYRCTLALAEALGLAGRISWIPAGHYTSILFISFAEAKTVGHFRRHFK